MIQNQSSAQNPQAGPTGTGSPFFSVVIPAYNASSYIAFTLKSVLGQHFSNYEIIVVNDGSPDTPALERALQPFGDKVRYFNQENRGPSSARNRGIRAARGKYVAFLDSDDVWLPHHLLKLAEALEADPSLGLIYANAVHIEGPRPVSIAFETTPQALPVNFENLLREACTINTSSTVASRRVLLEAGGFDENFMRCEDYDLWLRMARNGVKMTFTREIQMCHRLGNGLAGNRDLMRQARIEVYQKMAATQRLNEAQAEIVRGKIAAIEKDLQLEAVRRALLAGNFDEAAEAARKARAATHDWKLGALQLGLRWFPSLLQRCYRSHLERVAQRKREQRARTLRAQGLSTESLHLETLAGPTLS